MGKEERKRLLVIRNSVYEGRKEHGIFKELKGQCGMNIGNDWESDPR